ncbi:ABC transporter ATP-binding protein [Streptomyces sp. enrichment culture]|uniref:ABC transporter ATP-binding protein n=1 Tax=Streptomyces sp. enrichment culture TaxID=1795815 RepID=UPI003F56777A
MTHPPTPPAPAAPPPASQPTTEPVLAVRGLDVDIAGSRILTGITFDVPATGVTALLGRNGVGKTTTLRAVLGLLPDGGRVTAGEVTFTGTAITREPTHRTIRRGIGYAPEDRGMFAHLTVAENLTLAERPGSRHHYDLVHDLFPELAVRRTQYAGTLSGGQQQMVALARTLLNDNTLVIVDEPTKGLAPRVVTETAEVLERAAQHLPMLLVEQNLAVVRRLADQAVVLDAGQVVHTGTAQDLLSDTDRTTALLGVGTRTRTGRTHGAA